ncbi:MAG: APC family permease [Acidobacteriaceae bacterium]|nr:APC family permease [Acidobacteriaceae bacterium]
MQDYCKVESPRLIRALGVSDLTWLYLVAVVNLNVVPVIAAEGGWAIWLWAAAILFFFLPQGIAVLELAERMPGEGGLYLWTKETYGDFSGFICGWCYWLTNMFFVPSLLFYVTGVTAYVGASAWSENRAFFFVLTNLLLWLTIAANVRGLGVGKWVNNIGGIGSLVIAVLCMLLAGGVVATHRSHTVWSTFTFDKNDSLPFSSFGVVCLAMVGLEIGPVMGDEVRDPRRTFPRAILLGGTLSAIAYVGTTLSLSASVPTSQIVVVEGMMQAIDKMSAALRLGWVLVPLGIVMIASIAGSTSAWVSGSARILFVSGLDRYLPKALGRIHPRYGSPYIALAMFGSLTSAIIAMSFVGASVKEAYLTLLDLAVALQMISYVYLFLSLAKVAYSREFRKLYFPRALLRIASATGLAMTLIGFIIAFIPSRQISSLWSFEVKMLITLVAVLAVACGLFFYYRRQKTASVV